MTREIGPINEGEARHHAAVGGGANDSLQQYRLGSNAGDALKPRTFLPTDGQLSIPPLNFGDISLKGGVTAQPPVGDNTAGGAAAAAKPAAPREHVVGHHDSLWKIAEKSLNPNDQPGHKSTPGQIWNQVQNIVQANKAEHPQLAKNPHMLKDGIKLTIPEPRVAGTAGGGDGRAHRGESAAEAKPHKAKPATDAAPRRAEKPVDKPADPYETGDRAGDGGRLERALKKLGHEIAQGAIDIAHQLGTIGDCARGPRLTFHGQGFKLPPAVATEQGRMIRNSGLFDRVKPEDVRPGDYGVRDWNKHVIRAHGGVNKGDSFIVTKVGKDGTMHGANDHRFVVPPDGGRYRNLQFYRPNAEFLRRYGNT